MAISNNLIWSSSREATFNQCKRKYYYNYYAKWGGWSYNADPQTKKIYFLSKLSNLPIFVGSVVHDIIREQIQAISYGMESAATNEKEMLNAIETISARIKAADRYSKNREWEDNNKVVAFSDDYYGSDCLKKNSSTGPDKWIKKATKCFKNFCAGEICKGLVEKRYKMIVCDSNDFVSVDINGVPVYAIPDLVYLDEEGVTHVVDWKTGKQKYQDVVQTRFYSLYARNRWNPEKLQIDLVYLDIPTIASSKPTDEELDEAALLLKESFKQMEQLTTGTNVALAEENFLFTADTASCKDCNFREICPSTALTKTGTKSEVSISAEDALQSVVDATSKDTPPEKVSHVEDETSNKPWRSLFESK